MTPLFRTKHHWRCWPFRVNSTSVFAGCSGTIFITARTTFCCLLSSIFPPFSRTALTAAPWPSCSWHILCCADVSWFVPLGLCQVFSLVPWEADRLLAVTYSECSKASVWRQLRTLASCGKTRSTRFSGLSQPTHNYLPRLRRMAVSRTLSTVFLMALAIASKSLGNTGGALVLRHRGWAYITVLPTL